MCVHARMCKKDIAHAKNKTGGDCCAKCVVEHLANSSPEMVIVTHSASYQSQKEKLPLKSRRKE
jgi:hypothetical protein